MSCSLETMLPLLQTNYTQQDCFIRIPRALMHPHLMMVIFCSGVPSGKERHLLLALAQFGHRISMLPTSPLLPNTHLFLSKQHRARSFLLFHAILCILYVGRSQFQDLSSTVAGFRICKSTSLW